jgi:benzoate/toluate 1,2-dioxygenase beta subunit
MQKMTEQKLSPSEISDFLSNRIKIEEFLIYEASLLDERKFEQWRDLFVEEGWYWVPLSSTHTDPEEQAALFYDDKAMMKTRIDRLRHPRIHSQTPPHSTCHQIGNVRVDAIDFVTSECTVRSTLFFADYRLNVQRNFAAHVQHRLRLLPKNVVGFNIVWKRVDLINAGDVHELIAVPF